MQSCVSASRDRLGAAWQAAYLTAPIWRFWLGSDICGATVVGAFMSSLDGVGRYYPLTVFAYADTGVAIPPPDIDAHDDWFAASEAFLLSTLDKEVTFPEIITALDQLNVPANQPDGTLQDGMSAVGNGAVAAQLMTDSFSGLFASLRNANHSSIYAAASFWWTVGGGDVQPLALACRRMPDPFLFTRMLSGRINSAAD
jgi:type VI secretion system protein ImpM